MDGSRSEAFTTLERECDKRHDGRLNWLEMFARILKSITAVFPSST